MENITGQTVCIAIEHETAPDKTAIPQALADAALKLRARVSGVYIPYFAARAENSLMHCINFRGSLQAEGAWSNGIFHNSPYFLGSITPHSVQWVSSLEHNVYDVDFQKCHKLTACLRARKNLTLADAITYVEKQISKLPRTI